MKKHMFVASLAIGLLAQSAHSDEQYAHFPALESNDLQTAICNIQTYNQKLNAILSAPEITVQDMVKVHELTYTLENAVNFLKGSLEQTSIDLEKVHKASEVLDASIIKNAGKRYMNSTTMLGKSEQCK